MSVESFPHTDDFSYDQPTGQPKGPNRLRRLLWQIPLGLLIVAALGVAGGLYALDRRYAEVVYPNVSIRGIPVGERSLVEATALIEQAYAPFLAQPVVITYGGQTWTPTLSELGVRLEVDSAVQSAYDLGRRSDLFSNLRQVAAIWQNGQEIPLQVTIDADAMQRYVLARTAEVEQTPVDAELIFDGTFVASEPSASGYQVLVGETIQEITAAVQSLAPQTVALRTRELLPTVDTIEARAAQARIAELLSGPVVAQVGERIYEWSLNDLAALIRVEQLPNGNGYAVEIDRASISDRLVTIADETEVKGEYPRVAWNGGELAITRPGTTGERLDLVAAEALVFEALNKPTAARTLSLPFAETPPPVNESNLGTLGINELLSAGRSDFSGSADYRITNIKAGMRLLNGILLAPGEEFSFNDSVGRIDASNGFVEGYAIIQNRTQLEWGGGICQDSTTVFRAAFWAGLPITERWGHSFYISWYDRYAFGEYGDGPGMDATIFTPGGPDLKFLNDTGNWLLIEADTRGSLAEVRIYGTDTGRRVSLIGPEISNRVPPPSEPVYVAEPERPRGQPRQSDTARGGMEINFTRVIEQNGQIIEQRIFTTKFKPWPNIFEYNPADLGPDGKPIPAATPTPEVPVEQPPVEQPPVEQPPVEQPAPPSGELPPAPPIEVPPPEGG